MTISAHQIDNVLKAYSRQRRPRVSSGDSLPGATASGLADTVTLSGNVSKDDFYRKVSYTLLDLLKK